MRPKIILFDHVYMIGEVTRQMLPHLSGVPHLHVNRPKSLVDCVAQSVGIFLLIIELKRFFSEHIKRLKKNLTQS